jgi:hypothetical protein
MLSIGRPHCASSRDEQEIQSSIRLLDRVQRKVDAPASSQGEAFFQSVAEAVSAFGAAAAQARMLRDAAASPAAELLQVSSLRPIMQLLYSNQSPLLHDSKCDEVF